jgi:hypothetical protein
MACSDRDAHVGCTGLLDQLFADDAAEKSSSTEDKNVVHGAVAFRA